MTLQKIKALGHIIRAAWQGMEIEFQNEKGIWEVMQPHHTFSLTTESYRIRPLQNLRVRDAVVLFTSSEIEFCEPDDLMRFVDPQVRETASLILVLGRDGRHTLKDRNGVTGFHRF